MNWEIGTDIYTPTLGAQSISHWATREVPGCLLLSLPLAGLSAESDPCWASFHAVSLPIMFLFSLLFLF